MKRAEWKNVGFGRWKWVDCEYCDRCGREVIVPWEAHRDVFGYDVLDGGCYNAVYHGQDVNVNGEPVKKNHFVGALTPTHTKSADELNEEGLVDRLFTEGR